MLCKCDSSVVKLGHTGARTLATGGCAPPVQALLKIIGSECTVTNRELGAKSVYSGTSEKGTLWGNGLCPL